MTPKKQKDKDRRRARKLAEEAWEAADAGNLDLAEKLIRRAVATQPENPVLWNDQGRLLVLRDKDTEADKSFRTALRMAPTYAEAFAHLAALRARHGFLQQAVDLQRQAVKHAPLVAEYAQQLAGYTALNDQERARFLVPQPAAEPAAPAPPLAEPADADWPRTDWPARLAERDWEALGERLTREGGVLLPGLLDGATCERLRGLFDEDARFSRTVEMDRPEFGLGVYRYFRAPLPAVITDLRGAIYPHVARLANRWQEMLGRPHRYPETWEAFRDECHRAGQTEPAVILLKYGAGGFNALHRDLRGRVFFPIQLTVVLSPREADGAAEGGFQGGDFLVCDVPEGKKAKRREYAAGLGDAVLFCTRDRLVPIGGVYGLQPVKHGVTPITAGTRVVLGVPFHEYR
jgi:uncharacterized protein